MVESKYLNFIKQEYPFRKTPVYEVQNKSGERLGGIMFYPAWRKFVFNPAADTLFDANCLSDIIIKLNDLTAEWRTSLKKEN